MAQALEVRPEQIAMKKKVGRIGNTPVWEMVSKGGYNMIFAARDGVLEPLGVGPHRAVSRHLAMKREPKIEWTELSKSDPLFLQDYALCLPEFEEITAQMRKEAGF